VANLADPAKLPEILGQRRLIVIAEAVPDRCAAAAMILLALLAIALPGAGLVAAASRIVQSTARIARCDLHRHRLRAGELVGSVCSRADGGVSATVKDLVLAFLGAALLLAARPRLSADPTHEIRPRVGSGRCSPLLVPSRLPSSSSTTGVP